MRHILVGVSPAIAVFLGIFIWKYFRNITLVFYLTILTILLSNIFVVLKENKNGQTIFPLQLGLTLSNEMKTVDYSYQKAKGEYFSISTLTSPLFTNTLWSYVYNWYGVKRYGYLPSWYGKNQIGQLGDNLIFDLGSTKKHFFIIEPTYGIPELYVGYAKGEQESTSKFMSEEVFGDVVIQEREMYKK